MTASVMRPDEKGTMWMHTGDQGIMDSLGYLKSGLNIQAVSSSLLQRLHTVSCRSVEGMLYLITLIDLRNRVASQDIIIRGGENLFPVEIENALLSNTDILEAAAVAIPDERYGEVVGTFIVRRSGSKLTEKAVRESVTSVMNPQVRNF